MVAKKKVVAKKPAAKAPVAKKVNTSSKGKSWLDKIKNFFK
ncbi:MAG: hypothetical protein PHN56_05130 [Candidatus Nanoarchaeia archaeon]|nr:hypothetical protein [Candidatus Nanoarchaeia archaeon]